MANHINFDSSIWEIKEEKDKDEFVDGTTQAWSKLVLDKDTAQSRGLSENILEFQGLITKITFFSLLEEKIHVATRESWHMTSIFPESPRKCKIYKY